MAQNYLNHYVNQLFNIEPILPLGFSYQPQFLTADEEEHLHQTILKLDLKTFLFRGYEAKRKVASFGYDYHFNTRSISEGIPIPNDFHSLMQKVADHLKINPREFTELLVSEYPPGSVINWA